MENPKLLSVRDLSGETGFSVAWIGKLIRKLKLNPEVVKRGEAQYEMYLNEEEAKKLMAYAKKRQAETKKREALVGGNTGGNAAGLRSAA